MTKTQGIKLSSVTVELSLSIFYKNKDLGPHIWKSVILEASLSFTLTSIPSPGPSDFLLKCFPSSASSLDTAPPPSLGHSTTAAPGSHLQALPHSSNRDLKCKYNHVPSLLQIFRSFLLCS